MVDFLDEDFQLNAIHLAENASGKISHVYQNELVPLLCIRESVVVSFLVVYD